MPSRRHAAAVALAVVGWLGAAIVAVGGVYLAEEVRCWENCYGTSWDTSEDAWQWHAVAAFAVTPLLAATGLVVLVQRRSKVLAVIALSAGYVLTAAFFEFVDPGWATRLDNREAVEAVALALGWGAPLAAVLLAESRPPMQ